MFIIGIPTKTRIPEKDMTVPGTRTAPALTGSATKSMLSVSWVDAEDHEYSDSLIIDPAATAAEKEAYVATAVLGSNASAWKVTESSVWVGAKNKANSLAEAHESVADKIRLSYKDLTVDAYQQAYIPAPLTALVLEGGTVDVSAAIYTNWKAAITAIVPVSFTPLNVEFVQNTQRNDTLSP